MATPLASTTTSTQLLAENHRRASLVCENSDANRVYILLGTGTASSSNYTFSLAQNANAQLQGWTGAIQVVWAGDGSGHLMHEEISR